MAFQNGIFTRGVLFDIPKLKNVPYLGDEEAIYPEDLEAWEKKAGFRLESGDAMLVHTGRWVRVQEKGPLNLNVATPGLYASCARWMRERGVAILGSDVVQDVRPSGIEGVNQPIHQLALMAPVSRIMVRQPQSKANAGAFNNGMPMTSSMGCGIWGGNITNENVSLKHYMQVTWVARPIPEDRPTEAELFGEFLNTEAP